MQKEKEIRIINLNSVRRIIMIIGYARVSKDEQNLDRQINQLNDYGV
ncbi:hypothetical protein BTH160X_60398 [Brochothrix thermosphacta]|nr:hypothetical protein BTH160X_60398 [Brochothrix thermosphacta]